MKTFKYDNQDFSKICVVSKVTLNLLSQNVTITNLANNVNRVTDVRRNPNNIKLDIQVSPRITRGKTNEEIRDIIAQRLSRNSVKPLILSNYPDRYFNAIFIDTSEIDITDDELFIATLTFSVPDGVSHSIETKKFTITKNANEVLATIDNYGTTETPIDIHVNFTSDANSIGIVSDDDIVQLGTSYSEDEENFIPSNKILNEGMGSNTGWSVNNGRVRWRYDSGDNTSKIMGALKWDADKSSVYPTGYGTVDSSQPGYWHGPTISKSLTTSLEDFEAYHRFVFKPQGNKSQKASCQGLLEINYMDADSNLIIGFEMKDNNNKLDDVTYSFFIGNYRMFEGKLPKSVLEYHGGFFGMIQMTKVGNKFSFRLARVDGDNWKETWSTSKSWHNETVAMLSAKSLQMFLSAWKADKPMDIQVTHSRITKLNTKNEPLIPKTFYAGDELFVEGKTNRVYINGIRQDDYRVLGSSQFLEAPCGNSEYTLISDGTFTGYLGIEECYL